MRTPDFDDLLAAFDIPDMVDPTAAIESGQSDHENQLPPSQDESQSTHDVGVSVIVKNTRNKHNNGQSDSPIHDEEEKTDISDSNDKHDSKTSMRCADTKPEDNFANNSFKDSVSKPQKQSQTDESSEPVTKITCSHIAIVKKTSTENCEMSHSLKSETEPVVFNCHDDDSSTTDGRIDNNESFKNMLLTDRPSSITTEDSGKGSSTQSTGRNPLIPKVRIKTIKTKTGQIQRTVTRVNSERIKTGGSSNNPAFRELKCAISSSPRNSRSTTEAAIAKGFVNEVPKQMTIKPVATAFLPVSAVKNAGSQVINLKLANNTTVKATVIPASSIQSSNAAFLKAANTIQQQTMVVPTSNLINHKLPKTMHLANLNLIPQTLALSACELKETIPLSQKQHQQLKTIFSSQTSKNVFENSQNSVVDAFNKVLSSINPVPIYVPDLSPPSSACLTLPSRGYKCLECGDSFALERSLAQHYGRRSVRIDVTCNQCTKSLVFYNKCSLLSHARSHKDKGMIMQCSHLILKPIPADQMIITSSPGTTWTNSTSKSQTTGEGSQNVSCILTAEDETSKLSGQSLTCWECSELFKDASSLAIHYQQECNGQKACAVCQMVLPNQCSFLSHQRIHKHKSPFICPECGVNCQSAHFQSQHITKTCLHYTRRNGYRCVHCSVILTDVCTLKSHIQSTHCEIFYKCPICPMAFKSAPGTSSHSYTQHPGVKAGEPKLIYKCAMCDTVFTLQSLLYSHLEQHVNAHKVPIFKCPDCSMYYAQKQLMLDHIQTTHSTQKTTEGPPVLGNNLPLSTRSTNSNSVSSNFSNIKDSGNESCHVKLDKNMPKSKNWNSRELKNMSTTGYTCGQCNTDFLCKEKYVGHVKKEHSKILKKHPCHHCEKSFCSVHNLCRHNRLKHKIFTCEQCPALSQTFTKRALLDQHKQLMHGDQEKKTGWTNIMETTPAKEMNCSKRKMEDNEVSTAVNCRSFDSQPLKKLKVNIPKVRKCAVCGFNTENMTAFHEHIPQHKSDGSSYQCKECGLCYTSPRSLSRHLFIVHRLKEPHRHRQVIGSDESQRENQLNSADENDDGAPNTRCKVCSREFETETILNTHMRTHGMAFIKAKASRLRAEKQTLA